MALDLAATQSAIISGLPIRTRWSIGSMPLDFDFSYGHRGLRHLIPMDIVGDLDGSWADLYIFGKYDFADGGGASPWLTIRESDGSVWGLDVERERALFKYNSSVASFIQTFVFLDSFLRTCRSIDPTVAAKVQDLDPSRDPGSEWESMLESLISE